MIKRRCDMTRLANSIEERVGNLMRYYDPDADVTRQDADRNVTIKVDTHSPVLHMTGIDSVFDVLWRLRRKYGCALIFGVEVSDGRPVLFITVKMDEE